MSTPPAFTAPSTFTTSFTPSPLPSPSRCPSRAPPRAPLRVAPSAAIFDVFKNASEAVKRASKEAAEERRLALEALKGGRAVEYVREKAKRDVGKVKAFSDGLTKSREKLARDLNDLMEKAAGTDAELNSILDELQDVLIMSDLGVDTVDAVIEDLRRDVREQRLQDPADIKSCLKASLVRVLVENEGDVNLMVPKSPPQLEGGKPQASIVMVIGANGMGKTTTIGKLAQRFKNNGHSVLVAACDTFRAGAVSQLDVWAQRAGVEIHKPREGQTSPSGVVYDALVRAEKNGNTVLIVDTSGRLHTNRNLMSEMQKMRRSVESYLDRSGRAGEEIETLLVVDASIGRNAVAQAKAWKGEIGVSGLVVTKLDGTARAGFVVSVVKELDIPVKLVGVGEGVDDLRDFEPVSFVEGLVGE